ncbi:uncharacterized protein SCHCODRAFT_02687439 [Schizophyllum commune H4-8]|uniref:F-box domain-containing protein n=1 Tax=Schizophyllum commune (strain H4-8 / FGSC 9210) TaxID=578458 RepID=D8PP27_SCHCM|nr:uncharacterized protein SCHCODRAFT_02687439 [Schizophyllum commune H4-8]KAI5893356.1 hypothetical protein SCHCODRAFT_02687439 [Schizophyllum commune H4-8]
MPPRRSSRIRAQRDSSNKAPLQKPAAPKAQAKRSKPRAKQSKVDGACNIPRTSAPPSPPAPLASARPSSPTQAEATAQASRNEPSGPALVASDQAQPRDPPSSFESLPLDIFLEIARQCDPRSLYHLSKVSKACRRVLRQPSNRVIWKEVFAAHVNPLPTCPEDIMTELQLAEITYGTDCMDCDRKHHRPEEAVPEYRKGYRLWAFCKRVCGLCLFAKYSTGSAFNSNWNMWMAGADPMIATVSPNDINEKDYCTIGEVQRIHELMQHESSRGGDLTALSVLLRTQSARKYEFAQLCREWQEREDARIELQRIDFIKCKSREVFDKQTRLEAAEGARYQGHPWYVKYVVRHDQEMTDAEWDTIEAAVRKSVHDARCRLLQAQTGKLENLWLLLEDCCQRVSEQTGIEVPFMDIICGDVLKAADTSPVLSLDQEVVDAKLRDIRAKLNKKGGDPIRDFRRAAEELLPAARARNPDWESRCTAVISVLNRVWPKTAKNYDDALARLVPDNGLELADVLALAAATFMCDWCKEVCTYPDILKHACLRKVRRTPPDKEYDWKWGASRLALGERVANVAGDVFLRRLRMTRWNYEGEHVSFYHAAYRCASRIVRACGLSSKRATAEDVDEAGVRFHCAVPRCQVKIAKEVMDWRELLHHCMDCHADAAAIRPTWCKIEEQKYGAGKVKGKRSRVEADVEPGASPSKKRKIAKK